ncbi:MAG: TetR/AcrR family transcriptional regulator [Salibacteraceae bacterium]
MPSTTFENLAEEKRTLILTTALDEFAANNFQNASITNLVRTLGIAKGSIYQYFSNKLDLYLYLIELAESVRKEYLSRIKIGPEDHFFKWLREVQLAQVVFEMENPRYGRLLKNAAQEVNTQGIGDIANNLRQNELTFFRKALKKQRKKGKIRKDTSVELQAHVLKEVNDSLSGFFSGAVVNNSKRKKAPSRKAVKASLKELAILLERGLSD